MARVTVEDCVTKIPNRFELVMLASQRARDISAGADLTVDDDDDKHPVIALREIAEETVTPDALAESLLHGLQRHAEIDEPDEDEELALADVAGENRAAGSTRPRCSARPWPTTAVRWSPKPRPSRSWRSATRFDTGAGVRRAGRRHPRAPTRSVAVSLSAATTERHPCTPAPPQYAELAQRVFAVTPDADGEILFRAYEFTTIRHRGQRRASGDAYASHPIEVAGILADLRLDTASIVTGLLHDTVEDGVAVQGEIDTMFGAEIGHLVDGVTKLGKIQLQSHGRRQAENFQKFLLAMSKDIRVLLVKLADRLHNMRTLRFSGRSREAPAYRA